MPERQAHTVGAERATGRPTVRPTDTPTDRLASFLRVGRGIGHAALSKAMRAGFRNLIGS